tara:strand:+ start:445 stop:2751 length:2307 start_codon:yes stop_codon:yes gene_type:complete
MNKLKLDLSASLEILKKSKFFNEVELNHLKTIASYSDYISVEKDEVLFNAGEKHSAGIFYLISGKVNLYTLEGDNDLEIVREVYENEIFNSLSIFYEKNRSNTALTSEQSSLLFIPKESLVDLGEKHFNFNKILHEKITIEFNLEKLLRILSKVYSKEVDHGIFRKIINLGEWVSLKNNTKLFNFGDPSDSMFFLVRGFLKVFIPINNNLKEVGEIKEGEVIGEMGLLSDEPRSASIYSTRESILFKITKDNFDDLMRSNPSVLFALSKQIILRFKKNQNVNTGNESTIFLTLLYTSKNRNDPIVNCGIGDSLNKVLNKYDSSFFLSKEKIEKELSVKDINIILGSGGKYFPLDSFINRIAKDHKYIILETEIKNTPWTTWCMSLSDKFLFLLNPIEGMQNKAIIDAINEIQAKTPDHLLVDRQLIVCHNDKSNFPKRTIEFIEALKPISKHYHISINDENDFSRIARIIANKSIGLAFGGGGARGLAHIGAYKALLENGIPIDIVCGTSAGSMMAGIVASGFSINEIKNIWEKFSKDVEINWTDYNLPYSSILKDEKLHNAYSPFFGKRKIEDLWLPMFCCAVNISSAELEVFNRGKIWRSVRASSSLPGLVVPLIKNGSLYVDGGLINNMPGDILKKVFNSKLISVNVSPEKDLVPNFDHFPNQTGLVLKKMFSKKKYKNEFEKLDIPTLGNIMVRSIMVGSAKKTNEVADLSEIYLNIPTDGFSMLNYGRMDELIGIGYDYTINELKKYDLSKTLDIPILNHNNK